MAQPLPPGPKSLSDLYSDLVRLTFTTYKSRLKSFERVQARAAAWNTALVALAAATTVASVGLLVDKSMYGTSGEPMLVACAVLSLAVSLAVSSKDYPGRAVRLEMNYKELQALSFEVESAFSKAAAQSLTEYNTFLARYIELIKNSENHVTGDWKATLKQPIQRFLNQRAVRAIVTALPYSTLVIPVWLLCRFGGWVLSRAG